MNLTHTATYQQLAQLIAEAGYLSPGEVAYWFEISEGAAQLLLLEYYRHHPGDAARERARLANKAAAR